MRCLLRCLPATLTSATLERRPSSLRCQPEAVPNCFCPPSTMIQIPISPTPRKTPFQRRQVGSLKASVSPFWSAITFKGSDSLQTFGVLERTTGF